MAVACSLSLTGYAQDPVSSKKQNVASASKTANEKKDLVINTKMDTLSVIFQNTLIPIRSFSQLDSFIRGNIIGIAKPRVEIHGYPGNTYENFDRVIAVLKKYNISDFSFSMAPASP
jgi:hypothetical protein